MKYKVVGGSGRGTAVGCFVLATCSRILPQKLTVPQLFKKFPSMVWNPKIHIRVNNRLTVAPILSQRNSVYILTSRFLKIYFNYSK